MATSPGSTQPLNMTASTNLTHDYTMADLEAANEKLAIALIPAMLVLALMMVAGLIGNSLVCYVFCWRLRASTQTYLIVYLAVFDLLSCCIGMPSEIADMRYMLMFESIVACKIMRFINSFCAMGSIMTLVCIAGDRFRKVCRPLRRQLQPHQAKLLLIPIVGSALFFSWPALVVYGLRTTSSDVPGFPGTDCSTSDEMVDTHFPMIYNGVLILAFSVIAVSLMVLYCFLLKETKRHNRYMKKNSNFNIPCSSQNDEESSNFQQVPQCSKHSAARENNPESPTYHAMPTSPEEDRPLKSDRTTADQNDTNSTPTPLERDTSEEDPVLVQSGLPHNTSNRISLFSTPGPSKTTYLHQHHLKDCGHNQETSEFTTDVHEKLCDRDREFTTEVCDGDKTFTTGVHEGLCDGDSEFKTDVREKQCDGNEGNTPTKTQSSDCSRSTNNSKEQSNPNKCHCACAESSHAPDIPFHSDNHCAGSQIIVSEDSSLNRISNINDCDIVFINNVYQTNACDKQSANFCLCTPDPADNNETDVDDVFIPSEQQIGLPIEKSCDHDSGARSVRLETMPSSEMPLFTSKPSSEMLPSENTSSSSQYSQVEQAPCDDASTKEKTAATTTSSKPELTCQESGSKKKKKVKQRQCHSKTTIIAFLVTLVFILSFLPFLCLQVAKHVAIGYDYNLDGAGLVFHNLFLRSYFINSVSNPIIYGVLNIKFKCEVKRLVKQCRTRFGALKLK